MIAEQVTLRKQVPSADGLWIYRKIDNQYIIRQFVWLGKEDTEWDECNEEQKAEFEKHNAKVQEEQEKANFERNL
ncbi:MAG: hypothetical protein UHX00_13500 [Caryophanon sp.]|nr:hypothetical protein [Caryophanon sp.]